MNSINENNNHEYYEHEHSHEHCSEHDHDHHEHCCEHDHDHHHECPIKIHEHEGAIAVSFEKDCSDEIVKLKEILSLEMKNLEQEVKLHCGIVGHIKAAITIASETTLLSLTKDVVNEVKSPGGISRVSFAAIIVGVKEDVLHEAVEAIYDRI